MILLIDNYDSFSFNLYQMIGARQPDIRVIRNDELSVAEIAELRPNGIILSPGPGRPDEAGVCEDVVRELSDRFPILGVCLGHQAICEAMGGKVVHAKELMHGRSSQITFTPTARLFQGLPNPVKVGRYHSLAVDGASLPSCLQVTATAPDGEVMAVEHTTLPLYGVQFHPESFLTPEGDTMLQTFLEVCR